jgi:hypothetical protein
MLYQEDDVIEKHIISEVARLVTENEILKNWIINDEIPKCAVCKQPITNVSIQRRLRPYLWCSRKCFKFKPRKIIKLEDEFGIDIVEILKLTTKMYGNIKAQCNALGLSIPYFYSIVAKYGSNNHAEFMAVNAVGKRRDTYTKKIARKKELENNLALKTEKEDKENVYGE